MVDILSGLLDLETFSLLKAAVTSLVERDLNTNTAFFGSIYSSNLHCYVESDWIPLFQYLKSND